MVIGEGVGEGSCIRGILYTEGDTRVTEGGPVDNLATDTV